MCGGIGVGHAGRGRRGVGDWGGDSLEFNLRFVVSLHVLTREVLNAQRDVERLANLVVIRLMRRRHLCVLSLVSPFLIPPPTLLRARSATAMLRMRSLLLSSRRVSGAPRGGTARRLKK